MPLGCSCSSLTCKSWAKIRPCWGLASSRRTWSQLEQGQFKWIKKNSPTLWEKFLSEKFQPLMNSVNHFFQARHLDQVDIWPELRFQTCCTRPLWTCLKFLADAAKIEMQKSSHTRIGVPRKSGAWINGKVVNNGSRLYIHDLPPWDPPLLGLGSRPLDVVNYVFDPLLTFFLRKFSDKLHYLQLYKDDNC